MIEDHSVHMDKSFKDATAENEIFRKINRDIFEQVKGEDYYNEVFNKPISDAENQQPDPHGAHAGRVYVRHVTGADPSPARKSSGVCDGRGGGVYPSGRNGYR